MTADAILAIVHHLAAFGLVGALLAEFVMLRGRLDGDAIRRFGRIDALYGAAAVVVVVAGISRLMFGSVPADFYLANAFLWVKMSSLAVVGLVSIGPTVIGMRWRRALDGDAAFEPPASDLRSVQRAMALQLAVLPLIPISAALMARGIGAL